MESELTRWIAQRWLARPWLLAAWLTLGAFMGWAPHIVGLSIRSEPVSLQALASELTFVWSLAGGLFGMAALAEIEERVQALTFSRRWRVRGCVLLLTILAPMIPILLFGRLLWGNSGGQRFFSVPICLLAQMIVIALVAERIPGRSTRSIAYLALAWWAPAFARGWVFGPRLLIGSFSNPQGDLRDVANSALWSAWVGSMFTLVLIAIALDLVRRPHHEVRHPR